MTTATASRRTTVRRRTSTQSTVSSAPSTKPVKAAETVTTSEPTQTTKQPVKGVTNNAPYDWRDMQRQAKELGIKAGGKGITSDVLNHALTEYSRLGKEQFAEKYPELVAKKSSSKKSSTKSQPNLPECLKGMTFREAQAYVKQQRESRIVRGHKGKFDAFIKNGVKVGDELRECKATSWDGIVNLLTAIDRYVETKM